MMRNMNTNEYQLEMQETKWFAQRHMQVQQISLINISEVRYNWEESLWVTLKLQQPHKMAQWLSYAKDV